MVTSCLGSSEILSPLPNAFSQFDLDILHTLADRIVERRRQNRKSNASVTPKESGLFQHKLEKVVLNTNQPSALPRLDQISRKINRRTTVLGVLVIASAMLLGLLVGWRQGWQKATLSFRTSSPFHRANALSRHGQADRHCVASQRSAASFRRNGRVRVARNCQPSNSAAQRRIDDL